ncbi:CENP-B N-terminal DNA-binding domain [Popillia japonica]|uniref:CENP-B N-terminal DNA-binding domain n=1 Tax=Popillia japonica TaxID=7064 RepID=A0AAW1IBL8_POPJA
MPNKYRRTLGKRKYRDFSKEELENAIEAVKSKTLSLHEAAQTYGISKSTLWRKVKNRHMKSIGGQTVLSETEEEQIVETILYAADWGFPLDKEDIKDLIQSYLHRQGRTIKTFTNNKPGNNWYYGFIRRNSQLNIRLSENIKRSRAAVSPAILNSYFDELTTTLEGVPPDNILNYDETSFVDDPGRKRVVVRRGPIKGAWRRILNVWKKKNKGPLRKDMFSRLHNSTLKKLEGYGFGPIRSEVVFKRLPKQDLTPRTAEIAEVLKDIFEATRYPTKDHPQSKRKKLNVPADQSITVDSISTPEAQPSGSNQQRKKPKTNLSKYDFSSSDEVDDLKLDLTEKTDMTDEETEKTE